MFNSPPLIALALGVSLTHRVGMGALSAYLVLYNASCMLGWASALVLAVQSLLATGGDLTQVWAATGLTLQVSQWAMCLEIVHAATGMVRSPVVTVFLQVMSRLVLVVVCLLSPASSATWWCGMMAISWSLVEVPRYAFYLNGLLGPGGQAGTLYPVFWLRYSLFSVLYPTGISGEVGTMLTALSDPAFLAQPWLAAALLKTVLASYVPGAPFLYMNMVWNRKAAFKKRFAPPPPPPQAPVGVEFPLDSKGGRSTSEVGKKVFAAALAGAGTPEGDKASAACAKERNWRFGYDKHIVKLARLGCTSPEAARGTAEAGLRWMHEHMLYHSADQKLQGPFGATVDKVKDTFHTGSIKGTGKAAGQYTVPLGLGLGLALP